MNGKYILVDGKVVEEPDLIKWAEWYEKHDSSMMRTTVGNVRISTIFLGLDHSFTPASKPIVFETMVFGGALDQKQWRYSSLSLALRGHDELVTKVKESRRWVIRLKRMFSLLFMKVQRKEY